MLCDERGADRVDREGFVQGGGFERAVGFFRLQAGCVEAAGGDDDEIDFARRDLPGGRGDGGFVFKVEGEGFHAGRFRERAAARAGVDEGATLVRGEGVDQRFADSARGAEYGGAVAFREGGKRHGFSTLRRESGLRGRDVFLAGRAEGAGSIADGLKPCVPTPIWRGCSHMIAPPK